MGTRYLKLGLPVVYENAEFLIGWEADQYFDLNRSQRDWLDVQVAQQQAWHRQTQLPKYAATLSEIARAASARSLAAADVQRLELSMRAWFDATGEQGLTTAGELMLRLEDAQIAYFRHQIAALNEKTAREHRDRPSAERRADAKERLIDRYEDMIGELTPAQQRTIEHTSAALLDEGEHRATYWRRWQGELFELLARRRESPACFVEQFTRMALQRERWYTPELRRVREHNEKLQRELALSLLTSLSAEQRQRFAVRANEWSALFANLARKRGTAVALAPAPATNNSCTDAATARRDYAGELPGGWAILGATRRR